MFIERDECRLKTNEKYRSISTLFNACVLLQKNRCNCISTKYENKDTIESDSVLSARITTITMTSKMADTLQLKSGTRVMSRRVARHDTSPPPRPVARHAASTLNVERYKQPIKRLQAAVKLADVGADRY